MENNIYKNISKFEFTNSIKNLNEYKEYELIKENYKFNILIGKSDNDIIIRIADYETLLKNNDIPLKFDTIDNYMNFYLIYSIKKIVNEVVVLLLKEKKEEGFEIILKNNKKEYKVQNKNKDEANNIKY